MEMELNRGLIALVDDIDYPRVNQFIWSFRGRYVKNKQAGLLHRFILGITNPKIEVDHRNRNTLDNRRLNLRTANRSLNMANRKPNGNNIFKGIRQLPSGNFRAQIKVNQKQLHLGCFVDPESAARAYDVAALQHFGEHALLNFED